VTGDIVLLVMTDGRGEYLERTLASFDEQVSGPVTERVIHDDSGETAYRMWLARRFPSHRLLSTGRRLGYAGAVRNARAHLAAKHAQPWVFSLEDDFEFRRPVNLGDLAELLLDQPHLAQIALRRQAWGAEVEHGGFVEQAPGWYHERSDRDGTRMWVETRRNWTCNPSLFRSELCSGGWPDGLGSEGTYGQRLLAQGLPWGVPGDQVQFAYWGSIDGGRDTVWHIGEHRAGWGH
jgi:hypothetical protein